MRTYLQAVADRIIETDGCVAHDWLVGVAKHLRAMDASSALRGDAAPKESQGLAGVPHDDAMIQSVDKHRNLIARAREFADEAYWNRSHKQARTIISELIDAVRQSEVQGDALRALKWDLINSARGGLLFNDLDEPLEAEGKRVIRKIVQRIDPILVGTQSQSGDALRAVIAAVPKLIDAVDTVPRQEMCSWCSKPKSAHEFYNDRIYDVQGYNCPGSPTGGEYRFDELKTAARHKEARIEAAKQWLADQLSALLGDTRSVITEEEQEQQNDTRVDGQR